MLICHVLHIVDYAFGTWMYQNTTWQLSPYSTFLQETHALSYIVAMHANVYCLDSNVCKCNRHLAFPPHPSLKYSKLMVTLYTKIVHENITEIY